MNKSKFISLENITIRLKDRFLFKNTSLMLQRADNLLVVGANGSGKTTLVKAIAGLLPVAQGEITLDFLDGPLPYPSVHKDKIAYISFDAHKKIHLENEFKKDLEDLTGKSERIINLSTGQTRKYLIEKALKKNPAILILDEPFDGLDVNFSKELKDLIEKLSKKVFLILVTHRADEIIKGIKKAVLIRDGKIEKYGSVKETLHSYQLFTNSHPELVSGSANKMESQTGKMPKRVRHDNFLIDFRNVSVEFDGKKILEDINWQVREGENWAVLGPNGAGKSTLIKLITGENLQVFANEIKIFGLSRNKLDIDELNKKIGLVSADLSLKIHDYQSVDKIIGLKNFWIIQKLGLLDLTQKTYGELSFGQKRLVLIAKALSKSPQILILDEPCHGLDATNRLKVLNEIELIARTGTTIILITHHQDEIIPSVNKIMHLRNGRIEKISDLG